MARCFTIYCKKCGEELAEDQKFCTKCGTPVNGPEAENFESKTEEKIETVAASFEKDPQLQDHWIRRLIAYIIDSLIVSFVAGVILLPFNLGNIFGLFNFNFPFFAGLISLLYFPIMELNGATFGKGIMNLKVKTKDGSKMTLDKVFIRNISKLYPVLLLLDLVAGLVTSTDLHQKYSDKIAYTTVE